VTIKPFEEKGVSHYCAEDWHVILLGLSIGEGTVGLTVTSVGEAKKLFFASEVTLHASRKDCWVVIGGKAKDTLMPATLLDHVTSEMRIFREEAFGPVKGIVRVSGVEAAVACANDNEYGLAAAVFGRDVARAIHVAGRIESGICHVNGPTVHDEAQMPFGGVKGSGIGRFGGKAGVEAFTELRWLTVQTTPRQYPF